jgi:ABC-type dipeptide/oligopeptide/nickel transport system permease component
LATKGSSTEEINKISSSLLGILPIILGVILLTGLLAEILPTDAAAEWFGRSDLLDALIGALVGSISAGHPLTSYVVQACEKAFYKWYWGKIGFFPKFSVYKFIWQAHGASYAGLLIIVLVMWHDLFNM